MLNWLLSRHNVDIEHRAKIKFVSLTWTQFNDNMKDILDEGILEDFEYSSIPVVTNSMAESEECIKYLKKVGETKRILEEQLPKV